MHPHRKIPCKLDDLISQFENWTDIQFFLIIVLNRVLCLRMCMDAFGKKNKIEKAKEMNK